MQCFLSCLGTLFPKSRCSTFGTPGTVLTGFNTVSDHEDAVTSSSDPRSQGNTLVSCPACLDALCFSVIRLWEERAKKRRPPGSYY